MKKHFLKWSVLISIAIIIAGCSSICKSPICTDHIFIGSFSGDKIVIWYPEIWEQDSIWAYSMSGSNKINGYELDLILRSGEKINSTKTIKIICSDNKIGKSIIDTLKYFHPRINKLIFRNFKVVDKNNKPVKLDVKRKIEILYFSAEFFR